jgi:UDP-N-acetylmuramoyl-tripeptide--D-alanyl-D-alanine ligase
MSFALQTLAAFGDASTRRAVVFGDMLELGERSDALHDEVARFALGLPIDLVYPVGERARAAFGALGSPRVRIVGRERVAADLVGRLEEEADAAILVKGSRGMRLEEVVEDILRLAPPAS